MGLAGLALSNPVKMMKSSKTHFEHRPTDERRGDYCTYGTDEQFIVPLLRDLIQHALNRFASNAPAGAKALDVGCGAQPLRDEIVNRGFIYTSVDVVQNAAKSVDILAPIDETLPGSLEAAGPFDLILCTEVLEHVADWNTAFTNFAKLLAPSGRIIITCPFVWKLHEEPFDFWRPTLHALRSHGCRVGLSPLEERAAGSIREALGTMISQVRVTTDGHGPSVWLRRKFIGLVRRILVSALRGPLFRNKVRIEGGYYLTSYIVLGAADVVGNNPR
jgi:SAM-dependent methyltransferase